MVNLDPYRSGSPAHLMRTLLHLHRVIADGTFVAERFPTRAPAARQTVAEARRELLRTQQELANLLLA